MNEARRGGVAHHSSKRTRTVAAEDGVLAEVRVVAVGIVVAEVRAAALGAGEGGSENGVGHAAQGLRFREAAAGAAAGGDFGESGFAGGLRGQILGAAKIPRAAGRRWSTWRLAARR